MMEKYNKILIDGNNLFCRNWFVFKDSLVQLENGQTLISGPIKGSLASIKRLEKMFGAEDCQVFILWDNANSKCELRKQIDPDYKLNREKKKAIFYRSLNYLQFVLLYYKPNYSILFRHTFEADDLVKPLISKFSEYDKILLCSEDMDWSRLISQNINWYANKKLFDRHGFQRKYKFYPDGNNVTLFKAIRGDKADSIPIGIKKIRLENLIKLLNDFDDIYDLLDGYENVNYLTPAWKDKIRENESRLRLNYQLADFLNISAEDIEQYIFKSEYSPRILFLLLKTLGYKLSEMADYTKEYHTKETYDSKTFFKYHKLKR